MTKRLSFLLLGAVAVCALSCATTSGPGDSDKPDAPDVPGLVAFYDFEGTLEDGGTDGLDAESVDPVTYAQDHNGRANAALYVDGAVDTIRVESRGALDIIGELTIAAWIKPELCSMSYNAFVDKSLISAYSMGVVGGDTPGRTDLVLYIHDHDAYLAEGAPVGQGIWEHVACTFVDAADTVKFFIDGEFAYAQYFASPLTTADTDLRIGSSHWRDNYKGALDQLAIFDRALTPTEIRRLYDFD
ncbi:MAG: LamG domain-containing protein [Candidatus Eisenbacteria bacterium]